MPEPVPCCLLGRLAVDQYVKGKGLGAALLVESIKITKELAKLSGCWALIVQSKGEEEAYFFFSILGFVHAKNQKTSLLCYFLK